MSKAQLVITAVVLEGRSKSEVARDYGLSRCWVHQLVSRYHADGAAAFEPRSRRPHHHRHADSAEIEDKIVLLGYELTGRGLHHSARSHSCRSATFNRPTCLAPSRLVASVAPCSVSKSVANPRSDKCSMLAISGALLTTQLQPPGLVAARYSADDCGHGVPATDGRGA
jgi:Winged helix-turn helix